MSQSAATVLDGRATAERIKGELAARIERLKEHGITPALGTLLVGDDEASRSYVDIKHRDCADVGIESVRVELPGDATQGDIESAVDRLNRDPAVTAFIVQLPLPSGINEAAVLERGDPAKDADGLHPVNLGRLVLDVDADVSTGASLPCTASGVIELLKRYGIALDGRRVIVIGRGATIGRPLGLLLAREGVDATVTVAHERTADLANEVRRADVVIATSGEANLVRADWIMPGAAVLDAGSTRVGTSETGKAKLAGDVDPEAAGVAGWLTPNPGGLGPMTRVMLLVNVTNAAERAAGLARPEPELRRLGDDLPDDADSSERGQG
ncbi:bifunctional protein FolD [Pseudoclavibacter endophyticus]|uniref:Bifunctional protein FolD n=1 Tax=Pseudoclavibacter endophyticus TaxID=1778590 RepID=A0A6H9WTE8_9MICO|nr:bifunctional methylenetetrahydrofolate dehydrogenase/methenyltetrahydrofolate cyclohydrolase [Pseudoclavibacter endophyticus]GGA58356.1 bifunctional protein FolD [Pseudoclavibacter endophyticus]